MVFVEQTARRGRARRAGGRGLAVFSQRLCRLSLPTQIGDKMKSGNVGVHIYSPRLLRHPPEDYIETFRTDAKFAIFDDCELTEQPRQQFYIY